MQTLMSFGPSATPKAWYECDWTPGRGRTYGPPHINYSDKPIIGSAGGPPEVVAYQNVNRDAEQYRQRLEQARVDFVILRYRYYTAHHGDFTRSLRHAAVARDTGLTVYEVALILSETYAYVA